VHNDVRKQTCLREKKQCEVAKQCKSNPRNSGNMLIVSLNHKPELMILKQWVTIIVS